MKRFNMMDFQPTALLTAILTLILIALLHLLANIRPMFTSKGFLFGPQKALQGILLHPRLKAFAAAEYLFGFLGRIKIVLTLETGTIWSHASRGWADSVFSLISPIAR